MSPTRKPLSKEDLRELESLKTQSSTSLSEQSIRLVTPLSNGLNNDTASAKSTSIADDVAETSMHRIKSNKSLNNQSENEEDEEFSTPYQRLSIPNFNFNFNNPSLPSLPRQSSEVTAVGEINSKSNLSLKNFNQNFVTPLSAEFDQSHSQSLMDEKNLRSNLNLLDGDDEPNNGEQEAPQVPSKNPNRNKSLSKRKKLLAFFIPLIAIVIIVIVIAVPVTVTKKNNQNNANSSDNSGNNLNSLYGEDGSTVGLEDGSSFTYDNKHGGNWNGIPLNNTARAQSYTPSLNEKWDFNKDRVLGVNIGGWLVPEPFIAPALFEQCEDEPEPCVDEYTLSTYLRSQNRLEETMEEHYNTFITEKDFAEIAGAGLNWIRLPIPYWMMGVENEDEEPFYANGSFKYFQKAVTWARKYGLRINLDLHTVPGSQNGWNHSSKKGDIRWMNSPNGVVDAQRTLNHIRTLTELISTDAFKDVIQMFTIVNEPFAPTIGKDVVASFYYEAYKMIREITGLGEGKGPWIVFHDGFMGGDAWSDFLRGADRIALDTHPYIAFGSQNQDPMDEQIWKPCSWAETTNTTLKNFGMTFAGEFSLAINDCGTVNGVGDGTRYEGTYGDKSGNKPAQGFGEGACEVWDNWQNWDSTLKNQFIEFSKTSMESLQNYFFWTWKIGNSSHTNAPINPFWSYQLGLKEGYMTENPHTDPIGTCQSYSTQGNNREWNVNDAPSTFPTWMTGGEDAGKLFGDRSAYEQFPPKSINNVNEEDMSRIPMYTKTGDRIQLHPKPLDYKDENGKMQTKDAGDGWFNDSDDSPFYAPKRDCNRYRPPYDDNKDMPAGTC